ncbi:ABC transporter substrate-binding protein [Marinobacter sp. R17]|uniref:substrate-binding periplasmic protein n=1 Tax=Marinobacter sp. R17 TaxID=2484250 RepID=UPI000F4CDCFE|nr:ABC transporter substrate-binding protein [Marinobacter sp. R17]ROU00963.1 ABC transporter substrate-binding protein [Marinobacter sp. R17]
MGKILAFCSLLLSLVLPMAGLQAADKDPVKLYLYTENFPPYNMSGSGRAFEHDRDHIDGLCTEMVKAIMAHTDLEYRMKLRTWDYGYKRVLDHKNHGLFCTTLTDDRKPLFKWVGPLTNNLWTIFTAANSKLKINRLDDIRGLTIGGYRNDVKTVYLEKHGFKVSQLDSDDLNPKRLELGQIDVWIGDRLAGPYVASQQDVEGLIPAYSFNKTELYLAMNPDTSDAVVQKLQDGLKAIHENGMYQAIEDKYGL